MDTVASVVPEIIVLSAFELAAAMAALNVPMEAEILEFKLKKHQKCLGFICCYSFWFPNFKLKQL